MRINTHAHIFNLRSVFTPETMHILLNRLHLEGLPKPFLEVLYQRLERYLRCEIEAESIFNALDERIEATEELRGLFGKIRLGDSALDLQIDGLAGKLGAAAAAYIREKLLELYDLDKEGGVRQNVLDYLEFLRIAFMPSIEKVSDEVMGQMGEEDALVALSMDITDGLDDGRLYAKQLAAMSDAVLAYPGRLFPFVMVNPVRREHFTIMTDAIEKHGFWGVKLYPSLGYPVFSEEMSAVFDYCQTHAIPILTHCTNEGFRRDKPSGELAAPDKWRKVFERFPDLKVCFGHFGSDDALIRDAIPSESWTAAIIALMQQYPNVYADISFHTDAMIGIREMDKQTAEANYVRNVKALINTLPCKDRLLFGTDFWMVRLVTKDRDYWRFLQQRLTPTQFKRLSETNPVEYLGLPWAARPSDWLIAHHLRYFRSKKMKVQRKPAKWLEDAMSAADDGPGGFVVVGTAPSWSRNNWIHYFLYEYLHGSMVFRQADRDAELPFEAYGRFKLANLSYWDNSVDPHIFDTTVRAIASNINKIYKERYGKWVVYNTELGITETIARRELISALKKPDWYVYQLAELCDALYVFKKTKPQGGDND